MFTALQRKLYVRKVLRGGSAEYLLAQRCYWIELAAQEQDRGTRFDVREGAIEALSGFRVETCVRHLD